MEDFECTVCEERQKALALIKEKIKLHIENQPPVNYEECRKVLEGLDKKLDEQFSLPHVSVQYI